MGLRFAVVTAVARDDLPDGGAAEFVAVIRAIRARTPGVSVEVLIPDCKGDPDALDVIFAERPDVLNHNLETVARLQRAVRPSAGLRPLARASWPGPRPRGSPRSRRSSSASARPTAEVLEALADLRGVGVDIVTIGQYLRPTSHHLPVAALVDPRRAHRPEGGRRGHGHRPRRGRPARPLQLPRPPGRRRGILRLMAAAQFGERVRARPGTHGRARRRRRAALGGPRPAVPHGVRGHAARAAHDARAAPRRATPRSWCRGSRRPASSSGPTCSRLRAWERDRRPDRHRGRARRAARPAWPSATAPGPGSSSTSRARCRRRASHGPAPCSGRCGPARTRPRSRPSGGPGRPPTGSPPRCRPATSSWSAAPRRRCRPSSAAGCSPRATTA